MSFKPSQIVQAKVFPLTLLFTATAIARFNDLLELIIIICCKNYFATVVLTLYGDIFPKMSLKSLK